MQKLIVTPRPKFEAVQLNSENFTDVVNWVSGDPYHDEWGPVRIDVPVNGDRIETHLDDYIVHLGDGDFEILTPAEFEAEYAVVPIEVEDEDDEEEKTDD